MATPPLPAPEGFEATAAWVGSRVWLVSHLFEVVGTWSTTEPDQEARVWFATVSRHLGGHASQLGDLLPLTAEHRPEQWVVEPKGLGRLALEELDEDPSTVSRLVGLSRVVLERLADDLDGMAALTTPAAGAPLRRSLSRVGFEWRADRDVGEAILQRLLDRGDGDLARQATARERSAEARWRSVLGG